MERVAGKGVILAALGAELSAAPTRDPANLLPRLAAQAAVREEFRNARRDSWLMVVPHWKKAGAGVASLAQSIQINLGIPHLDGLHQFIPGDFALLVSGGTRHHAGKCGFGALRSLIVVFAARDAFHESFLLFRIGKFEIGVEIPGGREFLALRFICIGHERSLPWFIAPNAQRARVGRLRRSFGAEEALGNIPPALCKLRGAESDFDAIGIME